MTEPQPMKSWVAWVILTLASATAVLFASLWAAEKARKPREVVREIVREVPKEVIREVPKEVVREVPKEVVREVAVPAKPSRSEEIDMKLGRGVRDALNAPATNANAVLSGIATLRVGVSISPVAQMALSEDRARDRFELVLRRQGIMISESSPVGVYLYVYAGRIGGDPEHTPEVKSYTYQQVVKAVLEARVYRCRISVSEGTFLERGDRFMLAPTTTWEQEVNGSTVDTELESRLLHLIEEGAEHFANAFLAAQQRTDK